MANEGLSSQLATLIRLDMKAVEHILEMKLGLPLTWLSSMKATPNDAVSIAGK